MAGDAKAVPDFQVGIDRSPVECLKDDGEESGLALKAAQAVLRRDVEVARGLHLPVIHYGLPVRMLGA